MMKCPQCDSLVEDHAKSCWNCFAEFEISEGGGGAAANDSDQPLIRPNGGALMGIGWALVAGSILVFFLGGSTGSGARSTSGAAAGWLLILLSGAMFQVGLFMALAGTIVRAIWFLPGEDRKKRP